jgi:hypothetical protein
MSALGEGMTPGETGTVTEMQHMPDQLPDNPSTIAANTSIETLQNILYQNWVWRNTFVIDASMQPGHVFGAIKIHPKNCNDYITHISKMFLTWNGAFKVRTRFMATYQFGGSFRIGFLPPRFSQAEVENMPIQTLTAYPNVDLDPKNTMWSTFQASDERNVLFHWMTELTDEKPESFAGWFVFYVAAPLVISGGSTSVSMLVEAAGSFDFAQLAPITAVSPSGNGWLAGAGDDLLAQPGCDDRTADSYNAIQILPVNIKSLLSGFTCSNKVGGGVPSTVGSALSPFRTAWRNRALETHQKINTDYKGQATLTTAPSGVFWDVPDDSALSIQNAEQDTYGLMFPESGNEVEYSGAPRRTTSTSSPGTVTMATKETKAAVAGGRIAGFTTQINIYDNPINTTDCFLYVDLVTDNHDQSILHNELPDESLVTFVNTRLRTVNLQTTLIATALKNTLPSDPNTSQLYQLFSSSQPAPLMTLRVHPSGIITTSATDAVALLPNDGNTLYLRYLQDLPMNSPLPQSVSQARFMRHAVRAIDKRYSALQRKIHLWKAPL